MQNLLGLIFSRFACGIVVLAVLAGLWLISPEEFARQIGGEIGTIVLLVIVRVCLTPLMLIAGAWLVTTGFSRL